MLVVLCGMTAAAQSQKISGGVPDSITPHVSLFLDSKQVHGRHSLLCFASFTDPERSTAGVRFSALRVNGGPLPSADSMSGEFPLSSDSVPTAVTVEFKDRGVLKSCRAKLLPFTHHFPAKLSKAKVKAFLTSLQESLAKDESMDVTFSREDDTTVGAIPYEVQLSLTKSEMKIKMGSLEAITTGKHEISAALQSHTARQSATVPVFWYVVMAAKTEEMEVLR